VLRQHLQGVYLYGSAVAGGLRAHSDLDLFVVVDRPTSIKERRELVDSLRPLSSRALRAPDWRPVELTIVVESDIRPWRYPPRMDFQYGEWLREQFDAGIVPEAGPNPDLAVLLAIVRNDSRALLGPPSRELLDPVPAADLEQAMRDSVPDLLTDLDTDTTNVLLTLARAWYTLVNGDFLSKDAAAEWAIPRLAPNLMPALARARDIYLGDEPDDWAELLPSARMTARALLQHIEGTP